MAVRFIVLAASACVMLSAAPEPSRAQPDQQEPALSGQRHALFSTAIVRPRTSVSRDQLDQLVSRKRLDQDRNVV